MTNRIDPLLRDTLAGRATGTPATPCLDAETAAALADDTLGARERRLAEAHAADCSRCQALLAAIVTTMPPAAPHAWWRRPAIAWVVPVAVAATAILVWVNIPSRPNMPPSAQTAREAPRAAASESAPVPPAAGDAARRSESQSAHNLSAAPPATPAPATAARRERPAAKREAPAATPANVLADSAAAPSVAAPSAAAVEPPPAPLPSTAPQAAAALQSAPAVEGQSREAKPADAAPETSVAETVTFTETMSRAQAGRLEGARDMVIVSSNPISRWRVGAPGIVHHSGDGGVTWQAQSIGARVVLTAGSSPSPAVCWLVGREGVVLITTDEGRSWQRVPFPQAIDLISIRASDGTTAAVVGADGRSFTTSDRGVTWKQ